MSIASPSYSICKECTYRNLVVGRPNPDVLESIRPMIETVPLEQAADGYACMMQGKVPRGAGYQGWGRLECAGFRVTREVITPPRAAVDTEKGDEYVVETRRK
jgi:hypothetical protein